MPRTATKKKVFEGTEGYRYFDERGAHLHTLNSKPLLGTSTVTGIINKPLAYWAAELSAVECLEAGERIPTIREEYLAVTKLVQPTKSIEMRKLEAKYPIFGKARRAHNEKKEASAEAGTDLHAEIELYIKECIQNGGKPMPLQGERIQNFIAWAVANVKQFLFSEMHCYSEIYWLGGITDFGYIDANDKFIIGDIKSSKEAYFSQFLQASLYGIQIAENGGFDKDGNRIFEPRQADGYAIYPFGNGAKEPTLRYHSNDWTDAAVGAIKLYKLNEATQ